MNKYFNAILFAAILVLSCSENNNVNNPVVTPPEVMDKEGTISEDQIWSGKDTVYQVVSDCYIEAEVTWGEKTVVIVDPEAVIKIRNGGVLTIEEGVTVRLNKKSYIEVGKDSHGKLIANGSSSAPISFEADSGAKVWGKPAKGGIVLGDSAEDIKLNYCSIKKATAGIFVKTGSPTITNCQISSCEGDGIYFDSTAGPSDSLDFAKNKISDCGGYPLTLPAKKLLNLSGSISFSASEESSGIKVLGTTVEDSNAVWKKMDLPYIFSGTTMIGSSAGKISKVTIMPGVVCKFEKDACIKVGDFRFGSGELIAKGTESDSIYFINKSQGSVWGDSISGIWIGPETPAGARFEYCSIQNATTGIFVWLMGRITVLNCLIKNCEENGVTFKDGGGIVDSSSFLNNTIVGNKGYGISITADQLANLSGTGSVADNGKGGILVTGFDVWNNGTWKKHDAPYIVDGFIDIGGKEGVRINIKPGTIFEFLKDSYIRVGNSLPGTVIAKGSSDSPIIFRSFNRDEYWGQDSSNGAGIMIQNLSEPETELRYCQIENATSGGYVDAAAKIEKCTFADNKNYGLIRSKNAESASISNNSYSDNGLDSIYIVP